MRIPGCHVVFFLYYYQYKTVFFFLFQIDKSNSNEVVLKSLEQSSSGTYRCEVSAEAPSFQTVFQDRDMITVGMYNIIMICSRV